MDPGLPSGEQYYSSVAKDAARVRPDDLPGAIGVLSDPADPASTVGIAFGAGWLGGWVTDWNRPSFPSEDLGPIEATWRLQIGKAELEGRFALRMGAFVELSEDAR